MNVRRSAAVLGAVAVIGTATPAIAADPSASASPSTARPSGLYGSSDPKYDGVWRQSLAMIAQRAVGVTPSGKAVDWLAEQQCSNGAFAAFRADTSKPCEGTAVFDTNATAAAAQALVAVGDHYGQAREAVEWLKGQQNKDGGWGYAPERPSDTNSTGVVVGALTAVGDDPAVLRSFGKTPYDLLAKWSIACDEDGGGALAYQPDKKGGLAANADATAAGVLGALGKGFVTTTGKAPAAAPECSASGKALEPKDVARNGAAYLTAEMHRTGDHLMSALPGAKDQPDYGNTADAVVALAAQGWTEQAKKPYAWLEKNSGAWVKQSGPAAYAELILAAHAMGEDPRNFAGTDLVRALDATGPAPQTVKKPTGHQAEEPGKSDSGHGVWWIVGTGLVAGIGIGFLLSGRRKRQQP
ncbi:prenyltransferase/squalene oxidase repeat-containing protein [Streptomyces sp. NPDC058964]|uniref:prenyltransferase/squalene oxidase repeat-containing protein n=1 Tax=Streptomyces sp. NPDC058964 TaxID=3346681 RepID=UPI00367877FB